MDVTRSNQAVLTQFQSSINSFLNRLVTSNPNWFRNFILVPYFDPGVGAPVGPVTYTSSLPNFLQAIQNLTTTPGTAQCPNPAMPGVLVALRREASYSHVYVFTSATAKDYGQQPAVDNMIMQTRAQVGWRIHIGWIAGCDEFQVNFVLGSLNPCNSNLQTRQFQAYQNMALASGGNIFFLGANLVSKVTEAVQTWFWKNLPGHGAF